MKNLVDAIEKFSERKIAVIGDIILDRTERGRTSLRKNPEGLDAKIIWATEKFYLGGAGNVAKTITSSGAECDIYGIIGDDVYGSRLKDMFSKEGIGIEGIFSNEFPTIVKARIFVDGKYVHRSDLGEYDEEGNCILCPIIQELQDETFENLNSRINTYNAIIFSDYAKRVFSKEFTQRMIALARQNNIPVVVDAKPKNIEYFEGCTLICPNEKEAEEMSGISYNHDSQILYKMSEEICEKIHPKYIVITCGENGAYVYNNGGSKMIPTRAEKVEEVTGAGDTFTALATLGLSSGLDVYDSSILANIASGIAVGKVGTYAVSKEELLEKTNQNF